MLDTARVAAREAGVDNVEFAVGDIYALDLADASFDVVHADQVLQHLTDPVAALREMRRVCTPGGVVAARDSDYATFTWWPEDPRLTRWLELYHDVARSNDAEPDAGRRLLAWAHEAGFTDVTATASVWCFANAEDRAWWGGMWTDRIVASAFADQAIDGGLATRAELEDISDAWRTWSAVARRLVRDRARGDARPRLSVGHEQARDRRTVVAVDGRERLHRIAAQLRRPLAGRIPERQHAGDDHGSRAGRRASCSSGSCGSRPW